MDFEIAISLIIKSSVLKERLELLIQNTKEIKNVLDICTAFDDDLQMNWGKTILHWCI